MERDYRAECGFDEVTRLGHQRDARAFVLGQVGCELSLDLERAVYVSAAIRSDNGQVKSVALAIAISESGQPNPTIREDAAAAGPIAPISKTDLVIVVVVGEPTDLMARTLLADCFPAYVAEGSGSRVILAIPQVDAEVCVSALGLQAADRPDYLPSGYVSLRPDVDPLHTSVGRAVVFGEQDEGDCRLQLNSMSGTGESPSVDVDLGTQERFRRLIEMWSGTTNNLLSSPDAPTPRPPTPTQQGGSIRVASQG